MKYSNDETSIIFRIYKFPFCKMTKLLFKTYNPPHYMYRFESTTN